MTPDLRYRIDRIPCTHPGCKNGRLVGTRAPSGSCGSRRGSSRKRCPECFGRGYLDMRVKNDANSVNGNRAD